jgi:hypothetical protein
MEWESCWRNGALGCIGVFDLIFIILAPICACNNA